MSFADNLTELRKLNNLSQEELAGKIGVFFGVFGMVTVGDEGQGLALLKEDGFLDLLNMVRNS